MQVELFYKVYDERVLLVAHSWGDNVARAFLAWMEGHHPGWVDTHIAVHFNAAGPTLGVPKALTALLSGAHATVAISDVILRIIADWYCVETRSSRLVVVSLQ